jgi:hypothetical protein
MKKQFALLLLLPAFFGLAAPGRAGQSDPLQAEPTATPTPPPVVVPLAVQQPTPEGYGPDEFPIVVNPLTGMAVEQFQLLDRRPMVVKITNYPRSVRPQSGLSQADIVYEYYMERGISRFIAVFYGKEAEKVGPVRSGRFFDEHIFRMYDGVFVFGSADQRVMDHFLQLGTHWFNSLVLESEIDRLRSCAPRVASHFCRDRSIISYNNMFTNTTALTEFIAKRNGNYRPDLTGMHFADRLPSGGEIGLNVYTRYSLFMYNWWQYSVETGKYLRSQETVGYPNPEKVSYEEHVDDLTGERISADNVVVLIVPHEYFIKTATTEIIDIHLEGQGRGYVFREGFAFPIIWSRPPDGGVLNLLFPDGGHFPLKPGNTWYQVVSEQSTVERFGIDWTFTFAMPDTDGPVHPERSNTER